MFTPLRQLLLFSLSPFVSASGAFDAATATNQLGLDLFRELTKNAAEENLTLSPYSIESALALIYVGAKGETRAELHRALRYPDTDASFISEFATLREAIATSAAPTQKPPGGKPEKADEEETDQPQLSVANRLYGQQGYAFRESFRTLTQETFTASFEALDFRADPEQSRQTINTWVGEQTRGKIRDLLPRESLSATTRLVLANALYFRAGWVETFDKDKTEPRPFHVRGAKNTEDRATMQSTLPLGYTHERGLTVVALAYQGNDFQCLILLPDRTQTVQSVAAKLTPQSFARWTRLLDDKRRLVDLQLPKFESESASLSLRPALHALGVKGAFDEPAGSANFDRIAPRQADEYLALSDVHHKTVVILDEDGTEAAAATVMQLMTLGVSSGKKPKPIDVRVDRPFLFAIQHRPTGTLLFLGQITDPKS